MLVDTSDGYKYVGQKGSAAMLYNYYTMHTSIGRKGRCYTRWSLWVHSTQARKSAGKKSTLDLKPMRKDTQSPKQEQSVAPQNGHWSNKIKKTALFTL